MASHSQKMRAMLAAKDAEIAALRAGINDFRIYVATNPKFGHRPIMDADGLPTMPPTERMDWIATSEVLSRLTSIEYAGLVAGEETTGQEG